MGFDRVEEAIADIRRGRMVVVVDDRDRENEGDVIFAAARSTPAKINFLAKHARGLICVALTEERVQHLQLPLMVQENLTKHGTAFTVSVEAREGTTTGISARDRSLTAMALSDAAKGPEDFVRPGHIFPLRARKGGVLVRAGHTEAAVDLVQLAGAGEAGVICEIMNDDGTMARLKDCFRFAREHSLRLISVEDLIHFRRKREKLVQRISSSHMPTPHGEFIAHLYEDVIHRKHHLALVRGGVDPRTAVACRVHVECVVGDVFQSMRCECGQNFSDALRVIGEKGGIFLYLRHDDVDKQLTETMKLFELEDQGAEVDLKPASFSSDMRAYGIGAQILYDLGARKLNLLTNHPKRMQGLEGYGLKVVRHLPLPHAVRGKSSPRAAASGAPVEGPGRGKGIAKDSPGGRTPAKGKRRI